MSLRGFGLLLLASAVTASPALASPDARALDDQGRVLTVGNWALVTVDGGYQLRFADDRFLGWELRDGEGTLVAQGSVPGSESLGLDATPSLSRNPRTGEIWLAWSRQEGASSREIAVQRFAGADWVAGSLSVVASGAADQLEPVLVHDEAGRGWLAWIDGASSRTVKFLGLALDARVLGTRVLSEGSERNGPPSIGIDAMGQLFVAYAGTDASTSEDRLFILTPSPIPGGLSHLPDPIVELGVRGSVPAPMSQAPTPSTPDPLPSRVTLTVLGGTPVAWWTETEGPVTRLRYASEGSAGWSDATVRTVDLSSGMVASIPDALALIEARLRRVIEQAPGGGSRPIVVSPGSSLALRVLRR